MTLPPPLFLRKVALDVTHASKRCGSLRPCGRDARGAGQRGSSSARRRGVGGGACRAGEAKSQEAASAGAGNAGEKGRANAKEQAHQEAQEEPQPQQAGGSGGALAAADAGRSGGAGLEAQAAEEFAEDQAKFTDPWSEYLYVMDDISTTTSALTRVTS